MLILAIDTALDACAAGVLDTSAGRLIAQETQPMKRGHAEALMPLIGRVMEQAGSGFAALGRIAVTTGPGSFTGLRVGLSAARGIALAGLDEHRVVLALDFFKPIAHRVEEILVGGDDGAIQVKFDHGLRFADCGSLCDCIRCGRIIAPLQHRSSS